MQPNVLQILSRLLLCTKPHPQPPEVEQSSRREVLVAIETDYNEQVRKAV
jgi:hypothetical protein